MVLLRLERRSDAHLAFLGRNDGITGDNRSEDSSGSLNTQGERVDVEQSDTAGVAPDTC